MEVAIIGEKTLRIKSKNSTVIIDPAKNINKIQADATIYTSLNGSLTGAKIEGSRIDIKGPGEYEIGGIKVEGIKVDGDLAVVLEVEGVKLLIGSGKEVKEIHDKIGAFHVAVINADSDFEYSSLTSLEPNILIVYGNKREDVKKFLGKTDIGKASKFSITIDKLPQEMQMVLLE